MARKPKTGLDYFPFDVNFFDDDKIQFLSARFGHKGEIITIRLLCRIYKDKGYFTKWSQDESLLFAKRVGFDHSLVNDVVNELLKRDFLSEDIFKSFGILTSKGIQERYEEATERRSKNGILPEYRINVNNNAINVDINPINVDINTQSKVKEIKGKETKEEKGEIFFYLEGKPVHQKLSEYIKDFLGANVRAKVESENIPEKDQEFALKPVLDFMDVKYRQLSFSGKNHIAFAFNKAWENRKKNAFESKLDAVLEINQKLKHEFSSTYNAGANEH